MSDMAKLCAKRFDVSIAISVKREMSRCRDGQLALK